MIYEPSMLAVVVFFLFVGLTVGLSFYLGSKAKSSAGFFTAHGQIPWFINGVAFAGDYLSAASFLGICGMIAFYGYDGFLYSIGFLAGWIVALLVVAEPMKRLGKFTFADALDANFQSRGIKLVVGISTLVVSVFYLIPQMSGAGALIEPLFGFSHWVGVVMVGTIVTIIVVSAGMVSTTWVQFLKGSLLVVFSFILVIAILQRGFTVKEGGIDDYKFRTLGPFTKTNLESEIANIKPEDGAKLKLIPATGPWIALAEKSEKTPQPFIRIEESHDDESVTTVWSLHSQGENEVILKEAQTLTKNEAGQKVVNDQILGSKKGEPELHPVGHVAKLPGGKPETGAIGPIQFFKVIQESEMVLWSNVKIQQENGETMTIFYQKLTQGKDVLRPGVHPKFKGIHSDNPLHKLNFLSLMLALFCGTASLPHILIRYYTVKDEASARKSTIVGIATIGFFYVLTLFLGLGAMTSGAMDVTSTNMAAPLLAKSISELLFAIISAIAFTTVLGTVSGLILASSGAVTHDLMQNTLGIEMADHQMVRVAKFVSVIVGIIAIILGILFKEMNVGYLVGWAFSIAASANLPSLIMLLFWKKTTKEGIIAAVTVGMVSSLGWILLSSDTFEKVYGISASLAPTPFTQPGIVTIPLGFLVLVVVSLMTQPKNEQAAE